MAEVGFDGRVAIVTGGGGGLGRQHALLLGSRGAKVLVNDIGASIDGSGTDKGPAEAVAQEIRDNGGEAVADTTSITTPEGGQAVVAAALEAFGRVDIVVNNAGIMDDAEFDSMTAAKLDPMLDVHLRGVFFVTRPAWIEMQKQGYGRIVNTTSSAGLLGAVSKTNYGAAKGGVFGLTQVLAIEGHAHNIKVNAIAPMGMTRMMTKSLDDASATLEGDQAAIDMMHSFMGKLRPELISPVVAFLASEECQVTGEVYSVGGGQVSQFFLGRTQGHFSPDLSIEDVRDNLERIRDRESYTVPTDTGEETMTLFATIAATT